MGLGVGFAGVGGTTGGVGGVDGTITVGAGQVGSAWPVSSATTNDLPCLSLKLPPMTIGGVMALPLTLMGFWPVCSVSSTPGCPTYLQTKYFGSGAAIAMLAGKTAIVANVNSFFMISLSLINSLL